MAEDIVNARPIKEGKDPLAEGNTLVPKGEKHYAVLETSEDIRKEEKNAARMREEYHVAPPTAANPLKMPHKTRNESKTELEKALKGRKGR